MIQNETSFAAPFQASGHPPIDTSGNTLRRLWQDTIGKDTRATEPPRSRTYSHINFHVRPPRSAEVNALYAQVSRAVDGEDITADQVSRSGEVGNDRIRILTNRAPIWEGSDCSTMRRAL